MEKYDESIRDENVEKHSTIDTIRVLFKRKNVIIVIFLFTVMLIASYIAVTPDIYQSKAAILLRLGHENLSIDPTATVGQVATVRQDMTSVINSEIQILKSRDLAAATVEAIGVEKFDEISKRQNLKTINYIFKLKENLLAMVGYKDNFNEQINKQNEKIIKSVLDNFECNAVTDSNIIELTYEGVEPELTYRVLNEILKKYLDKHIETHSTNGSYEFFERQTETLQAKLQETGLKLKKLKNDTGITSVDKQKQLLLERIDTLKSETGSIESNLESSEKRLMLLENSIDGIPKNTMQTQTTGTPNSAVEELRKQIFLLELEEDKLLSKFSEESVPVTEIRRQIESANMLLNKAERPKQITSGLNSIYQQVKMNIMLEKTNVVSLQAQLDRYKSLLSDTQKELNELNNNETAIKNLELEMEIGEGSYRKYYDGKEQARIDNAMELEKISNISIAQPCTYPYEPVKPQKMMIVIFGLSFGFFGAIGIAFLMEHFDHSLTIPEDIENRIGLNVLGSVPKIEISKQMMDYEYNEVCQVYLPKEEENILINDSDSLLIEQTFDASKIDKEYENKMLQSKVIAITSSRNGEGVSSFAVHFASMLRKNYSNKVLLMDTNFKRPCLHKMLKVRKTPGMEELLSQKRSLDVIQHTEIKGLDLISVGSERQTVLNVNEKKVFLKIIEALKRGYEYIIIDTEPFWNGTGSKTTCFEPMADGVIIVIEAERIRWEIAVKTKKRLEEMNAKIIGAVLNKRKYHIPKWVYKMF